MSRVVNAASQSQPKRVHIRDMSEADYAAVRALTLKAYEQYAHTMPEAAWGALRRAVTSVLDKLDQAEADEAERIVADDEGEVVGSVLLYPPTERDSYGRGAEVAYPELRLLAVAPDARGLGVGRALVDECVRRARASGAKKLGLHTSDYMNVATTLYLKMGFVRAPEADFEAAGPHTVKGYGLELA